LNDLSKDYSIRILNCYEEIETAIYTLRNDLYNQKYNDNNVIKELAEKDYKNAMVLGLEKEKHIVGLCAFYANDLVKKNAFLSMLVINKRYQNKGIGRIIICEMIEICKRTGIKEIVLYVENTNEKAIKFYEKNGFTYIERKESMCEYSLEI